MDARPRRGRDVVVIRASGQDDYNLYFYEDTGVAVSSVETIRFESGEAVMTPTYSAASATPNACSLPAATSSTIIPTGRIRRWKYQLPDQLEKGVTVGGISAGMVPSWGNVITPSGSSLDAEEALSNPYHPDYEILGCNDFLDVPFTQYLVTDTHYEQQNAQGAT